MFRFYRYVPPPVYPAAYTFEFQSCDLTPQAKCFRNWLKLGCRAICHNWFVEDDTRGRGRVPRPSKMDLAIKENPQPNFTLIVDGVDYRGL